MRKAGNSERPGAWSAFRENWPAIVGATALGLAVALLGRWWLHGPNATSAEETVAKAADAEPVRLTPDSSAPADVSEAAGSPSENWVDSPPGWQFAPVPQPHETVRVVSVSPQEGAAPNGAWLTGRIEEVADEPPLANATRLLDDLPVRR